MYLRYFSLVCIGLLCSCSLSDDAPAISVVSASFDFSQDLQGWEADFVGTMPKNNDPSNYQFEFSHTDLQSSFGSRKAIKLAGSNTDGSLFMFLKRKITGLKPNTSYTLAFEVGLASDASSITTGNGQPLANNVFLKAGACKVEPVKVLAQSEYILNIDKGSDSNSGTNAIVLGNIASPQSPSTYEIVTRTNVTDTGPPFIVETNNAGEMWLLVGTETVAEGNTTVFYTNVNVLFSASY